MNNLLIRRKVNGDRGGRRMATTADVVELIRKLDFERFTTRDIANMLSKHPGEYASVEYAVRTALQWLCERGMARPCGVISRVTATPAHGRYPVAVYELCRQYDTCDVELLNRVMFGLCKTVSEVG